ncbi:Putative ribonuclease H protein At1g65750 [Linum perenne]
MRGCPVAVAVWRSLLPFQEVADMLNLNWDTWFSANLAHSERQLVFGIACWLLWRSRNELVFQGKREEASGIRANINFWRASILSSWQKAMELRSPVNIRRVESEIAWRPAADGWTTLNSDGSVLQNPASAAAGVALRDNVGRIQYAAAINLGTCSITRAEMRGAVEGMLIAWELNVRRLEIQLDSTAAISILLQANTGHQHSSLVARFQRLRARDWEIRIVHIYREANHLADCLAARGHNIHTGTIARLEDDPEVRRWGLYDARGVTERRNICRRD